MIEAGKLSIDEEALRAFCEKWQIAELALFGSVLRDDFGPDSDVDVLVTFLPGEHWRFEDIWDMKEQLRTLFGREVDLAQRHVVERDANVRRRQRILNDIKTLYAA